MKRFLLIAALAALAVAPAAHAAAWKGVVIAKDASRHAIVTTTANGAARTVRVGTSLRAFSAGQRVAVRATALGDGTFRASKITAAGRASETRLEGIFLGRAADGSLRIAVVKRGEILVAVPAALKLPTLNPGDQVELEVSVDAAGAFTLVSIKVEDDRGDEQEVEVTGAITALSGTSITVQPKTGQPVTCTIPTGTSVSGFKIKDVVEMKCRDLGSGLVLQRLKAEDDEQANENENESGHEHHGEGHGGHGRH